MQTSNPLSDGSYLELDDDGTIRRRDVNGNSEDVWRPGEEGYSNVAEPFGGVTVVGIPVLDDDATAVNQIDTTSAVIPGNRLEALCRAVTVALERGDNTEIRAIAIELTLIEDKPDAATLPDGHKLVAHYGAKDREYYSTVAEAIEGIENAHAMDVDLDIIYEEDAEGTTVRSWGASWKVSLEPQAADADTE